MRKAPEILLKALGEAIPRRDDKLANVVKNKGLLEVAESLRYRYEIRIVADYREGVSGEEARSCVERAGKAIEVIEKLREARD